MRPIVFVALVAFGCPPKPSVTDDAGIDAGLEEVDAGSDAGLDAGPPPLQALVGPDRWADVGEAVGFDASRSTGAIRFEWTFGDGTPPVRTTELTTPHAFAQPGRYRVVLRAFDERGRSRSAVQLVAVTFPPRASFASASTMVEIDGGVAVVVTDANRLTLITRAATGFEARGLETCAAPISVARLSTGTLAVACRSGHVAFHGATRLDHALGPASDPSAIVATGNAVAVSLAGTNEVAFLTSPPVTERRVPITDPRGLAVTPEGVLVGRFRSAADGGTLSWITGSTVTETALAIDPQSSSDTEIGGLPNLLGHVALSPDGRLAAVSSLHANVLEGSYRSTKPLIFETTIRATTHFVDVTSQQEQFDRRKQWDNRGRAGALAFSPRGDFLFVAMPANHLVERYDLLDDAPSGTLFDLGFDLRGMVVTSDGFLFVDAQLSREVAIFDVRDMRQLPSAPLARVPTISTEPLSPQLLTGKRLFFDAADRRLARDGYIACAHCHPDGDQDGIVWDFTDRGEGLRNTISLWGRRGTGDGPVHWSANFDEIQDFEGDIRGPFGGTGLMPDAEWQRGTTSRSLGDPKAGRSADLDALAAYVTSLSEVPASPLRFPDGGLTPAAERGKAIFERADVQCLSCHVGPRFTDSQLDGGMPLLHDVGTKGPGSGQRLNGPLPGLDTPTLLGARRTPPYLHDGSAKTLLEVLTLNTSDLHGHTSLLSPSERADLVAYLESL